MPRAALPQRNGHGQMGPAAPIPADTLTTTAIVVCPHRHVPGLSVCATHGPGHEVLRSCRSGRGSRSTRSCGPYGRWLRPRRDELGHIGQSHPTDRPHPGLVAASLRVVAHSDLVAHRCWLSCCACSDLGGSRPARVPHLLRPGRYSHGHAARCHVQPTRVLRRRRRQLCQGVARRTGCAHIRFRRTCRHRRCRT